MASDYSRIVRIGDIMRVHQRPDIGSKPITDYVITEITSNGIVMSRQGSNCRWNWSTVTFALTRDQYDDKWTLIPNKLGLPLGV